MYDRLKREVANKETHDRRPMSESGEELSAYDKWRSWRAALNMPQGNVLALT